MNVTVYNEKMQSIQATLSSFDDTGVLLDTIVIPVGGAEYDRPATATHWVFSAPGYQDAPRNDLLNADLFTEQLIPKYRWAAPAVLGLAAFGFYMMLKR